MACGRYFTNGRQLFRVVGAVAIAGDDWCTALEDCLTLTVQTFVGRELSALRLRSVVPCAYRPQQERGGVETECWDVRP